MKIAFLSHLDQNLYLFRLPIMQSLIEQGHEVYAVCPRGEKFDLFQQYGIKAIAYDIDRGSLNPIKELKALYNIYRVLQPLNVDILHTFTAKPNIYGTLAGKAAGIPVIVNLVEGLGSFYIEDSFKNKIVRGVIEKLYKVVFSISDKVVFVNSDDPYYLANNNILKTSQVKIIKSVGIDTTQFDPDNVPLSSVEKLRSELNIENKTVVLMVARAIWHKGIREYYEAAKQLSFREDTQFILVGDTDKGNPSAADPTFLQNENVLWLGQRDDILTLTAMCDIYVLPSYREGVPRTLLEAASMAKPIITTDTVGCREVVEHGKNGFLIPVKDTKQLTAHIECLLDDPKKRKFLGENGRIKATKEFDVKNIVAQYISLYQELMQERE